jgi:hypothetical protein
VAKAEIPPELGPEFSFGDGRRAGLSRRRLASSDLVAHFRGSRAFDLTPVDGDFFAQRHAALVHLCRCYLPVAPADFRFSHVTAARLYRIPLPEELEKRASLDVTVAGSSVPRRAGIRPHRMTRLPDLVELEGLPVLPVEQVWLQLAAALTLDDLVVAGDHLVRRKSPASSLARLEEMTDAAGGRRGTVRALHALGDIRPGTDSPRESRMRLVIVRAGLPEPVIGHTVYFQGHFVGTPDLAYVRERIALDYDGSVHRENERVYLDDVERRQLFADADWRYITVTAETLRVPRSFLARVSRLLEERASLPERP